jgi:hypothetical protein
MKVRQGVGVVLILLGTACIDACVDRLHLDIGDQAPYPVVIDGFISDQPPPYQILVTKAYDIQSKESPRERISVKQLVLSDDLGTQEEFIEVTHGVYQTSGAIRGRVGGVYKLYIRLLDGREYESIPDTLHPAGTVDKVYFQFREDRTQQNTTNYGFDVFFDSTPENRNDYRLLWKFVGTYKVSIDCCTCWPYLYNPIPMVSDGQLIESGQFVRIKAAYVPITGWIFMNKVHAAVNQMSLSRNAFEFWKAVKSQQEAVGSLFQPITGKIPKNFNQLSGEPADIYGIFFSTSVSSNSVYITKRDVPDQRFIPELQHPFNREPPDECIDQFPGSSSVNPPYWVD